MKINWVPDAIPITLWDWLLIGKDLLFPDTNIPLVEENENYDTISGFSCRSLFEIMMRNMKDDKKQFGISPIHHTSWRDIIQKYIPSEKITILELNSKMSEIAIDKLEETEFEKIDIVICTHMFGLDFDLSCLETLKEKYNWLVIEDRVQGGTLETPFSHPVVDLSFYSMGMDKRPCALGGGYVNIRKGNEDIKNKILASLEELPLESRWCRMFSLIQKIPTYALYSYQSVFSVVCGILPMIGVSLSSAIQGYRKKNPGFSHHNYLLKPNPALQTTMKRNKINYIEIEKCLRKKYNYFYSNLNLEYIPWVNYERIKNSQGKSAVSLTMYNTIFIKPENKEHTLSEFKKMKIPYLPNPTWKVLQVAPPTYQEFCDGLVYLPCLYHMERIDMEYLRCVVNYASN